MFSSIDLANPETDSYFDPVTEQSAVIAAAREINIFMISGLIDLECNHRERDCLRKRCLPRVRPRRVGPSAVPLSACRGERRAMCLLLYLLHSGLEEMVLLRGGGCRLC